MPVYATAAPFVKLTRIGTPPLERLMANTRMVDPPDWANVDGLCWEAQYSPNKHGYCKIRAYGRFYYVHRLSFLLLVGPLNGNDAHHKCSNRRYWNPSHLEPEPPELHRMYEGWYR